MMHNPEPKIEPYTGAPLEWRGRPVEARRSILWWQARGLSFTASGYGRKIPTSLQVRIPDRLGRMKWVRVYCCIFSNIGTCYVARKGEDMTANIIS